MLSAPRSYSLATPIDGGAIIFPGGNSSRSCLFPRKRGKEVKHLSGCIDQGRAGLADPVLSPCVMLRTAKHLSSRVGRGRAGLADSAVLWSAASLDSSLTLV